MYYVIFLSNGIVPPSFISHKMFQYMCEGAYVINVQYILSRVD